MLYTNPLYGVIRTLFLFLTGRVKFNKEEVGKTIIMEDGKTFRIFRRVDIKRFSSVKAQPEGLFVVQFTPKMEIKKNIRLSRIMLMIFMGFKGFRSKYWCVNEETGMCQGVYEWDTVKDAKRYSESIAMRNMTKRSVPGSISAHVLENIEENKTWSVIENETEERVAFRMKYHLA
jgi:hypothetical protein